MDTARLGTLLAASLLLPTLADAKTPATSAEMHEEKTAAEHKDRIDAVSAEAFAFAKGSATLTAAEESRLRNLIDTVKTRGTIKGVKIAAWSDSETPAKAEKSLSKADRRLAEQRGEHVKKFLHDHLQIKDAKIYNMAHGTNRLAELFHTEQAELRSAFAKKGAEKKYPVEVRVIRDHGKPSVAVVLVEYHKGP